MSTERIPYRRAHKDDRYIDEVSIKTIPRFKTSGLSGDEWRISARLELRRKGYVLWWRDFTTMEYAVAALPWFHAVAGEGPDGTDSGEWHMIDDATERMLCQQSGCAANAKHRFRFKKLQLAPSASETKPNEPWASKGGALAEEQTWFCDKHMRRGDAAIEDCDDNLEEVK